MELLIGQQGKLIGCRRCRVSLSALSGSFRRMRRKRKGWWWWWLGGAATGGGSCTPSSGGTSAGSWQANVLFDRTNWDVVDVLSPHTTQHEALLVSEENQLHIRILNCFRKISLKVDIWIYPHRNGKWDAFISTFTVLQSALMASHSVMHVRLNQCRQLKVKSNLKIVITFNYWN